MKSSLLLFILFLAYADCISQEIFEKVNSKQKVITDLSYTKEEIENFPLMTEKKYKMINSLTVSCQEDYNCGYEIKNNMLLVDQCFHLEEPPVMSDEELKAMFDYEKRSVEYFVLHFYISFKKAGLNLIYDRISRDRNSKICSQASQTENDNRTTHIRKTYLLENSIMNLFPKKIRVIDYIELKEKKGFYFLLLARPASWWSTNKYWHEDRKKTDNYGDDSETRDDASYEIYTALVKNKNQSAKLLYLNKEIPNSILFTENSIFGLEEKIIKGNRVVLFHISTYLMSGPIVLHDLHLVWLGKY